MTVGDGVVHDSGSLLVEVFEGHQKPTACEEPTQAISGRGTAPPADPRPPVSATGEDLRECDGEGTQSIELRDWGLTFGQYSAYFGPPAVDPRNGDTIAISEGIERIIEVEGPVVAKRVYDIYLRSCGIRRMGHELKSAMNKALSHAIRQGRVICEDEAGKGGILFSVIRVSGSPPIRLRTRGPRSFDEIPPSELQVVAKHLLEQHSFLSGSDEHLRSVLEFFDLKRLTTQVGTTLLEIIERKIPHVDEFTSMVPQ